MPSYRDGLLCIAVSSFGHWRDERRAYQKPMIQLVFLGSRFFRAIQSIIVALCGAGLHSACIWGDFGRTHAGMDDCGAGEQIQ
jgi:hypothetical protein